MRIYALMPICLLSGHALAGTISYEGTLSDANSVYLTFFNVVSISNVTLQTYGYGGSGSGIGGTNGVGVVIPPGGFDPVVAVFGPDGTFVDQNDDGACPPGSLDGGSCFDSTLELFGTSSGTYTVALTVAGNYAAGAHLSDGFTGGGDFFDRTNGFAVDIAVEPLVVVPEPYTRGLLMVGISCLVIVRARYRKECQGRKRRLEQESI